MGRIAHTHLKGLFNGGQRPGLWYLPATALVAGCTGESVNRSAYETAYQKVCLARTGNPICDPEHGATIPTELRNLIALAPPPVVTSRLTAEPHIGAFSRQTESIW